MTNVNERARTQAQLLHSETLLRATLDSLTASVALLDRNGVICDVNTAWRSFADANGYEGQGYAIGADYLDVVRRAAASGDGLASSVLAGIEGVLSATVPKYELEYPCHSPSQKRWFILNCSPIGASSGGAVVSHTDITERRLAEDQLHESDERFRRAVDASRALVYEVRLGRTSRPDAYGVANIIGPDAADVEFSSDWWHARVHAQDLSAYMEQLESCLSNRSCSTYRFSYRVRHSDGSWRVVDDMGQIVRDADQRPTRLVGTILDITDRVRAGEQLQALLEAAPDATITVDPDGRIARVNLQAERLFGYPRAELFGRPVETLLPSGVRGIHAEHRAAFIAAASRRAMGDGRKLVALRKDGTEFPIEVSLSPLQTADGMHVVAAVRDITARIAGEEAQARLAAIVQSSDDAIIGTDRDGLIVSWNHGAESLFGYSAAEAVGRSVTLLIPADRHAEEGRNLQRVLRGEAIPSYEAVRCRKDGSRIEVALTTSSVRNERGEVIGAAKIARDVTMRKHAEETLRERELLLRLAQRAANAGAWEFDFATERFVASDEALILHGIPASTPISHERALAAVHPDDRPAVGAAIRSAKEDGEPFKVELRIPRPDGSVRWILSQAEVQQSSHGRRLVGLAQDISDRKQAEEQLRRNAETFDRLIKNSPFGVYIVDSRFRLMRLSAGAGRLLAGIEPLIGRDFAEILRIVWPEPFASEAIGRFRHTLATGEAYHAPNMTERRGNVDAVESHDWQIDRISLPDGDFGVVCHYYDATRLREVEQALAVADRRKDEFLATLAHELRNPIATLRNALYAAARSPAQETATRREALMKRQVDHLARLVDDLMEVSRISKGKIDLRREPVTLAIVVEHAVEASRAVIDAAGHRLDVYLPAEPLTLVADPVRLTQVFVNLLNNAAKYTDAGGRIELSARRQGDEAVITIRDNGIGIPPAMLASVFDLFTQVERASPRSQGGLGIGLNLTRSLVTLHGGSIAVSSEGPGTGTTFVVRLPLPAQGRMVPVPRP